MSQLSMYEDELIYINKKVVIVPWSGGVDSTAIIFALIKFYGDITKHAYDLILPTFNDPTKQCAKEQEARANILEYIKLHHTDFVDQHNLMIDEFDSGRYYRPLPKYHEEASALMQPYLWITKMFSKYRYGELLMGYHRGDDVWIRYDQVAELINLSSKWFGGELNLQIPFKYYYKDVLFDILPEAVRGMVWYCEVPTTNGEPCGRCASCLTHNKFCIDSVPSIESGNTLKDCTAVPK